MTPVVLTAKSGETYAVVVHDAVEHDEAATQPTNEFVEFVSLDPNRDQDFADASSLKTATLDAVGTFSVGGKPTAVVAIGGR